MLNSRWQRILLQAILWTAVNALIVLVIGERGGTGKAWGRQVPLLLFQLAPLVINVWWLFPKLFPRYRGWYSLCGAAMIGLLTAVPVFLPPLPPQGPPPANGPAFHTGAVIMNFFAVTLAFVVSLFIEVFVQAQQREKDFLRLAKENVQTELQFLKSQINPHFLFNALNNIYTLSLMQSGKTPESIGRLSDMLRYVLYDGEKETVPLEKEIRYIQDYLSLFQLKKEKELNIEVNLNAVNGALSIPPMLLIPLIENALKHSFIEDAGGWVKIWIQTADQELYFKVENSIIDRQISKDEGGGIGLRNVRRRLDLLFPGRYVLEIVPRKDQYSVTLKLNFHAKNDLSGRR